MKQTTLEIISKRQMHCNGCEHSVVFLLSELDGIEKVEADHKTQRIEINFDPEQVLVSDMQTALANLGYLTVEP